MRSLWSEPSRRDLLSRLERLTPDTKPKWGKMSASQMLAHLNATLRMASGELEVRPKNLPIRFPPLKQLIVYLLPFPKGAPTAPELISQEPGDWAEELHRLRGGISELGRRDPDAPWPEHPAFGKLSRRAWGVLGYKHTDHHLKQFGL